MTQNTVTDRDVLFDELETTQERGIAFNDEELLRGQRAVSAPILDSKKRALGAISLFAP